MSDALNRVLDNLFTSAQAAVKNLLNKNFQLDSSLLRSSTVNSGRDLFEIALEKIVDKLNFQFYKSHANATYDPIREHMDYFRLPFNNKLAVLMENVYNSTLGAMYSIDQNFRRGLNYLKFIDESQKF